MTTAQMPGRYVIAAGFVLACVLLACPCVSALDPSLDINQYAHTSWKARDGFTRGPIRSIAQTLDGYLWLGTEFGLFRFDGMKNVPWQPPADQHLPSGFISCLLVARDGTLWIGTDKGLASWNGSRLARYPKTAGLIVDVLLEARDGTVWVGTFSPSTGKLCSIRDGSVQCYGEDGALGRGVTDLYEDKMGNLWVEGQNVLWRWRPGSPEVFPLASESTGPQNLVEDFDGSLLVGTAAGIKRLVDGKAEPYPLPDTMRQFRARRLFRDRDGGLWIGTSTGGVLHFHQGRTDVFSTSNGLSGDDITSLFEDREGNIWVATLNGLDRFREFIVSTFTVNQGLSNPSVVSVLAPINGSLLLATSGGLNQWHNGRFTIYGRSQAQQSTNVPYSLFQDDRGRIWAVTLSEFGYLDNGRFIPITGIPGGIARSIVEDTQGNLWIANQDHGLFHLRGSQVLQQIPWDKLGHKDFASALAFDPLQGGLWIGFFQGGIAYFRDGQVQKSYGVDNGLGEGFVNDFRLDQDGTLWAATAGGLSRLKSNRIATLTSREGLPCDTIHWLMDDDDNAFWLYTACGLVRIARSEVDAWAAAVDKDKNAKRTIQATLFDNSDGVPSRAYTSRISPQFAKTGDGRLWFPGLDGVSVLDPRHLSFNKLPPPVLIEQFIADHKTYDVANVNGRLPLPPLIRDLEIDYTALSLVDSQKVRFRYMLEGWDLDWQDAGNRRHASYTNLPPRNYRFRVMACNNSGVWNEAGTFLDFSVAAAYYQTWWFRISMLAAFVIALVAIYQMRSRQVVQQVRMRMEERLEERERIARDLHDTLLQSVQGLILKFDAAAKLIPKDEPARQAIEKTLDRADEVMEEGRDRVRNLRVATIPYGGLPAAFKRVAEETPQGRDATFKAVVEGRLRELHPMVREESFCIGREAIVNALTHSAGHHVEVEIIYDSRQFRLRVRDDGRGIEHDVLESGGRAGHWGLRGMRERAQRIGAHIEVWSRPGAGTEVELIVPAAAAYRSLRTKSKSS